MTHHLGILTSVRILEHYPIRVINSSVSISNVSHLNACILLFDEWKWGNK